MIRLRRFELFRCTILLRWSFPIESDSPSQSSIRRWTRHNSSFPINRPIILLWFPFEIFPWKLQNLVLSVTRSALFLYLQISSDSEFKSIIPLQLAADESQKLSWSLKFPSSFARLRSNASTAFRFLYSRFRVISSYISFRTSFCWVFLVIVSSWHFLS